MVAVSPSGFDFNLTLGLYRAAFSTRDPDRTPLPAWDLSPDWPEMQHISIVFELNGGGEASQPSARPPKPVVGKER